MMYVGLDCILVLPTLPAVFTLEIHRDTTNIGPDFKRQKNGVPLAIFTLVCGLCSVCPSCWLFGSQGPKTTRAISTSSKND